MARKPPRVYADTPVFGGLFDGAFSEPSRKLFQQIREERFQLVLSPLVEDELEAAPRDVQAFWREMIPYAQVVRITAGAVSLQAAYIAAGIVSPESSEDALHVAIATVAECSLIVSWNFRHIVHREKIPLYNAVNTLNGYPTIAIYSPLEVIEYEKEEL